MAWQTPKTNWKAADVVSKDDFNRIEGNIQHLQDTKETPAGAQAKAEAAAGAVRADIASQSVGKGADMIGLPDPNNLFTATTVRGALEELFTSVSNGKSLIAGAITDKGVPTSPSDTFQVMANNINQIPVGDYSIGDLLPFSSVEYLPCIWSFTGHADYVYAVAVDNNGYVYSGSYDKTVRKISPSGTQVWSFTGHTDSVWAVAVDNDGYVYSGSDDKTVRKISPSGTQVWSFTGHTGYVYAVAVDNNGYVYSGSDDKTVRKVFDGVKIIA